jgi:hypothetical protein
MARDTTLRYRGPRSVPGWQRTRAEYTPMPSSRRLVWGVLVVYALLVLADVATTLVVLSGKPAPMWKWEWNPITAAMMRAGGTGGWLVFEAVCIAVPWVLSPVIWRFQQDESMAEAPRTQQLIRRLVFVPLLVLCFWRGGAAGFNTLQIVSSTLGGGPSIGHILGAAPTATPQPTATATPAPTATATPRPRPTATPVPALRLSASPSSLSRVCNDTTLTISYSGNSTTLTLTAPSQPQAWRINDAFQVTTSISAGNPVTVTVHPRSFAPGQSGTITASVSAGGVQPLNIPVDSIGC